MAGEGSWIWTRRRTNTRSRPPIHRLTSWSFHRCGRCPRPASRPARLTFATSSAPATAATPSPPSREFRSAPGGSGTHYVWVHPAEDRDEGARVGRGDRPGPAGAVDERGRATAGEPSHERERRYERAGDPEHDGAEHRARRADASA